MTLDEKLMIRDSLFIGGLSLIVLWIALYLIDSRFWIMSTAGGL